MNHHLFFKYMEFALTRNNVCNGNIEGRERGCRQSLYRGKKTSDNTGGTRTRDFSLQHKTFSALNYAREPQWKNRVKELGIRSGLHSQKVELSRVKYFHAFVSSLNCLSHRCKQWQEKMRGWKEDFWPFWRGSQWGGGFYGYRLKFWLIYGYRLIFFSYS